MPATPAITNGGTQFTGPAADGTSGQVIVTDASKNLSFATKIGGVTSSTPGTIVVAGADNKTAAAGGGTLTSGGLLQVTRAGIGAASLIPLHVTSQSGDSYVCKFEAVSGSSNFNQFISAEGVGEFGIYDDALYFQALNSLANGIRFYGATSGGPGLTVDATQTFRANSFTVGTLPTAGTATRIAYASNGRKAGEGAGVGTGVLVFDDGTNWIACDTGATVAA